MTKEQKDAIVKYLEFHLISMVEHVHDDVDGIVQAKLYNFAYETLLDLDRELDILSSETLDIHKPST